MNKCVCIVSMILVLIFIVSCEFPIGKASIVSSLPTGTEATNEKSNPTDPSISLSYSASKILPLSEDDFQIEYNGFTINQLTTVDDLIIALGYGDEDSYESNNRGYISTIEQTQMYSLEYPDYNDPEIRIIYRLNLIDDSRQIRSIDLEETGTRRGIKKESELQAVIDIYGDPDEIMKEDTLDKYRYFLEEKFLEIAIDPTNGKVVYTMIKYKDF